LFDSTMGRHRTHKMKHGIASSAEWKMYNFTRPQVMMSNPPDTTAT
jgi:hypothetical protein